MKKDLLVVGLLVAGAALGIGVVVVMQAMQPEDEAKTIKPNTEAIAHLPKQEEKKTLEARSSTPTAKKTEAKPEENPTSSKVEPEKKKEATPEKIEPKIEVEPKKEIKVEPKIEVKVEPNQDKKPAAAKVIVLGNDIKLNDPDGAYALKQINGGDRVVVQGKIKTLTIADINDKSILDATLLEAGEIIFTGNLNSGASVVLGKAHTLKVRDINDHSTLDASALDAREIVLAGAVNSGSILKLHAPKGNVEILGEINDLAQIEIVAPGGKVLFKGRGDSVINGDARLAITAKDVELRGAVNGTKTQLDITLTKAGALHFNRLNGSVRLHYRKAEASDPEVRIDAGAVGDRADFRQMPPAKK
jgi:hypothetical protein